MARTILAPHLREDGSRIPLAASLIAHLAILLGLLLGIDLWGPVVLDVGSGPAGGGGAAVTVGLVGELQSGGAGLVKPAPTPKPEVFAPPEKKEVEPPPAAETPVFERAEKKEPPKPKDWRKKPVAPKTPEPRAAPPGAIPAEPEPGGGGRPGGSAGAGPGQGAGGVLVGSGDGTGGIDSWYVRQVEKRIGENWLKTALGGLQERVRTKISFEIAPDGRIEQVRIEESSGVQGIDLAARRAVLASTPLPPPPFEMRRRRIKFVANFEYPPR